MTDLLSAMNDLETELAALLNRYSRENSSNTPDFILAQYLLKSLEAYEAATRQRDGWYGEPAKLKKSPEWPALT